MGEADTGARGRPGPLALAGSLRPVNRLLGLLAHVFAVLGQLLLVAVDCVDSSLRARSAAIWLFGVGVEGRRRRAVLGLPRGEQVEELLARVAQERARGVGLGARRASER